MDTELSHNVSSPPNKTTYRKAVNKIRSGINKAVPNSVHIYAFNVPEQQLEHAHKLLDKSELRNGMRVTYSDDHNFIVRYMPGPVHGEAQLYWDVILFSALRQLTPPPHTAMPPGCDVVGATTFQFGPRKKQADAGIRPAQSYLPSTLLEVGDSESLTQLRVDARLWLEAMPEVQLVILLSISPPIAPHPNFPHITIELWQGYYPPNNPPYLPAAGQRQAHMVWEADWTSSATQLYILLSDIFRGPAPAAYGDNDRVYLNTVAWRQAIINAFHHF